jgi:hypothetical protein
MKNKEQKEEARFELKLADGRTRRFNSGEEMYNWTRSACKNWHYELKQEVSSDKR